MINQSSVKRIILLIICNLTLGCANYVTDDKDTISTEIDFSITFENTQTVSDHNYYLIFSDSNSFEFNNNLENNYFIIPGENYDDQILINSVGSNVTTISEALNFYYDSYFDSWNGIMQLKEENITLTSGSFSSETNTYNAHIEYEGSTINLLNYDVRSKSIQFSISISKLSLDYNSIMYFTLVITSGSAEENNVIAMITSRQEITLEKYEELIIDAGDELTISNGEQKIKSWEVSVY